MNEKEVAWLLAEKWHGQKTSGFLADCTRLAAGEPLAYVIGHIPFLNCTIYLDSKPLIPRTETEYWVEKFISRRRGENNTSFRLLDLCAGSGCIGVAVAKAFPIAEVTFAETDENHLPTITKNLTQNLVLPPGTLSEHYQLFVSDLFSALDLKQTFNFIVSNPPYLNPDADQADPAVKAYEPHHALYGGQDGLALIKKIIADAPLFLKPHGELWLEHEPEQTKAIHTLAWPKFFVTTHNDQYGVARFSELVLQ